MKINNKKKNEISDQPPKSLICEKKLEPSFQDCVHMPGKDK